MTAVAIVETEVAPVAVTPVMTVDQAVAHLNTLREFRKKVLVKDVDYGVIPGTNKPTLYKPGAEKLANVFGLAIEHQIVEKTEDWDRGFFSYTMRAVIRSRRDGTVVADCIGNCNSREDRYRYRNVFEWEATEEQKAKALKVSTRKKKKGSGTYKVYQLENTEPFSLVNTLQKMAQKRAMVGAVLIATRASEEYTQDVEDLTPTVIDEEPADHDTGEILDPVPPEIRDGLFQELVRGGVTKDDFPAFYKQATGRDWKQMYEQDVPLLRKALTDRKSPKPAAAAAGG